MKGKLVTLLILLSPMSAALAGQCEDNYSKEGNVLKGTTYKTRLTVPGLGVSSAIGQMRNIAVQDGMNVLDEAAEAGSLLLEEPPNGAHRSLQINVTASPDGTVSMFMKTRAGAIGSAEAIKNSMCKMLYQLKPGKGPVKAVASKPIQITSVKLAEQIEQQQAENAVLIDVRSKGKTYRVTGFFLAANNDNNQMSIIYDPNPSLFPGFIPSKSIVLPTRIWCRMAPDQRGYALTLRPGDKLDMTGTYDNFTNRTFTIANCRPNR